MSETHISYKTAKALKEFLKESAPEPMDNCHEGNYDEGKTPRYQLHDLLSKPFITTMEKKMYGPKYLSDNYDEMEHYHQILNAYVDGGLPAVEAELMRMMGMEE